MFQNGQTQHSLCINGLNAALHWAFKSISKKFFFAYYESDWWQEISATSPTVKPDIILNASKLD